MNITKKITCLFLSLILLFSGSVFSLAYTTDDVVYAALELIFKNEGVYTSILANDNGAVSLGRIGWHATRALTILQSIAEKNETQAKEMLGDTLYNEIKTATSWNTRVFTQEEKTIVSKLLATDESKAVQDYYAYSDIKGYILTGMGMGLLDGKVLVYFADLNNQMGQSGVKRVANAAIAAAGSADKVTLQTMYDAAMADKVAKNSPKRRKSAFDYCNSLKFDSSGVVNVFEPGKYSVTASALNVRTGPGTSYSKFSTAIPYGKEVEVIEVSGEWGKITYNGKTGWINLFYVQLVESSVNPNIFPDVNGNGQVDAQDARLTLRFSAGLDKFTEKQKKTADVDSNGEITASDARTILRISAGLN